MGFALPQIHSGTGSDAKPELVSGRVAGVEIGPSAFSFIAPDTRKASATMPRKTHEMIFIGLLFYSDFLNPSMRVWAVPGHQVGVSILRRPNGSWCLIGKTISPNPETRGSQLQDTLRSPVQVQFDVRHRGWAVHPIE